MTLPSRWAETTLGEACSLITDGTHHSPANGPSGDFPYVTAKHIKWHGLNLRNLTYVSKAEHEGIYRRCPVMAGDVLLIKDGATTGVATINTLQEPFSMLSSVALVRTQPGVLDNRYLWSWLRSNGAQNALVGAMSGTAIKRLTLKTIGQARLPVPPLPEQRRIVAKLDALTARLAQARKEVTHALRRLVGMREAALLRASDGSLSAGWRMSDANFHSSDDALSKVRLERGRGSRPDRRVTTSVAPSPLPRGWAWISADELAANEKYSIGIGPFGSDLVKGDYRESGIRLVFVRDVRAKSFGSNGAKYVSHDKAEQLKAHVVVAGDVLVTKMGDPPGDVAIYSGEERGIITADCIRVRPHPALVLAEFLELAIRFPCVQSQILAATKGVAQQKISLDSFRRMAIPVPPIEEQREIVDQLSSTSARADRLEAEAKKTLALIDRLEAAILARAFRGELVPQDPNDEPASVLLERIRARRADEPKAKRGRRPKLAS